VRQKLALFNRSIARINDDVGLEVENLLKLAQGNIQQVADARWQALEEPDVRASAGKVNMPQPLAAHLGLCDFHATLVADDASVLHALVLSAQALPIRDRAEDAGAEKPVALRLECSVIDRLRLRHLAVRPLANLFRRGKTNPNRFKIWCKLRFLFLESKHLFS